MFRKKIGREKKMKVSIVWLSIKWERKHVKLESFISGPTNCSLQNREKIEGKRPGCGTSLALLI